ncbi:hypothetical protein [Streptomyces sp. 8L]|uniref:hypothetical protein n=1 Tax=Streptomyces sp. 8L TaxID=2877242 RepID=UPI001CD44EB4|nr:hypothetical protein [Streptomyces sp. 8L]MCA1222979.1 hypothetical protein [Streptomyces sp. 8L]
MKSTKPERTRENLAVFDLRLAEKEMTRIAGLDGRTGPAFDHRDAGSVDLVNAMRLT